MASKIPGQRTSNINMAEKSSGSETRRHKMELKSLKIKLTLIGKKTEILSFIQQKNRYLICKFKTHKTATSLASFESIFRPALLSFVHFLCNAQGSSFCCG